MIYRDVFLLVFIIPCILSILLAYLSGKSERILSRILCFSGGVSVFWIGLVLASDLGFRMLQSDPDATNAAFNDTAPVGALLFGWLPASIFCSIIYFMTWIPKQIKKSKGLA